MIHITLFDLVRFACTSVFNQKWGDILLTTCFIFLHCHFYWPCLLWTLWSKILLHITVHYYVLPYIIGHLILAILSLPSFPKLISIWQKMQYIESLLKIFWSYLRESREWLRECHLQCIMGVGDHCWASSKINIFVGFEL